MKGIFTVLNMLAGRALITAISRNALVLQSLKDSKKGLITP